MFQIDNDIQCVNAGICSSSYRGVKKTSDAHMHQTSDTTTGRGFRGLKTSPYYEQAEIHCRSPSALNQPPCFSFGSGIFLVLTEHFCRNHQFCLTGMLLCPLTVVNSYQQHFWIFPETMNIPLLLHTLQRIFD